MELLLNLFWLTLAVPALWMWCRKSVYGKDRRRFDGIRPVLLLGCVLVLLFPVVSATDDLHAMRQEMEESSPSNRIVKQATGDKSVVGLNIPRALPPWISPVPFGPDYQACRQVSTVSDLLPQQAHSTERASRAPPFASSGEGIGFAV
jgi:hypothetical protein